ncbi:DUF5993 family protein [Brucella haematophila]|uniref:DUF5993 family protein n=1 Tax=Brucella haematophila TaxID=419474 RepID=UPI0035BC4881
MMSVSFFLFFVGLVATWFRRRTIALVFWGSGVVCILALFSLHATDSINIAL